MSASRLIGFDTPVWVAFIEQRPAFLPSVQPLFDDLAEGRLRVVTSVIGLAELLTGALRLGSAIHAKRVEDVLSGLRGSGLVPVTLDVARKAAQIRFRYGLRTPDALHVASAVIAGASEFVTMDRRLARVKEIEVRVLRGAPVRSKR